MTKVLIIGGGGMLGRKLVQRILQDPALPGAQITVMDRHPGHLDAPHRTLGGDFGDPKMLAEIVSGRPDVVYHLAAVVSGEAEADFGLGWQVNLDATRALLDALRHAHDQSGGAYRPRFIFSSSLAVFGPPYPEHIPDSFHTAPRSSYGAQKAIGELLVSEYARRGFIDGVSLRLPTVCVRPGTPNRAASSFFSGIIREPLKGQEAILPVSEDTRHWLTSPRSAVGFLAHAATLNSRELEGNRILNMPGVSCTVDEQIEALRGIAGDEAVALIKHVPDPVVAGIVGGWPRSFDPQAALRLGFRCESDFDQILQAYLEDDCPPEERPGR